jgi:type IV pilus assembly protein PilM
LGLDIGSYSVKLVEVDNEDGRYRLKNFAISELYGDGEEYDVEGPSYSRQLTAIRDCFRQMKINPKRAKFLNCSVGGPTVAVKQIRSVSLSAEELESSLIFEARKHLPLDDTEAILDYQILEGGAESQNMEILMVATTKKTFDNLIKLLGDLNLKPRIIDAESVSLLNSYFIVRGKPESEGATIFLDIGAKFSALTIFSGQSMIFSREIPIGGHKLTEDVKNIHEVEYVEAENIKKERGMGALLGKEDGGPSIRIARRMVVDLLVDEIRRSLRYYSKETGVREFDKMYICGGTAGLQNLNSHLAKELSLDVVLYNPFEMFVTPPGFTDQLGAQLANACGLALREDA